MNDDDLAPLLEDYFVSGAATQDREAIMFCNICSTRIERLIERELICRQCYDTREAEVKARQEQSFAQGECPKCGHDWTAHGAWIKSPGDTTCEEVEWSDADDAFLEYLGQEDVEHTRNGYGATDLIAKTNALLDTIYRKEE